MPVDPYDKVAVDAKVAAKVLPYVSVSTTTASETITLVQPDNSPVISDVPSGTLSDVVEYFYAFGFVNGSARSVVSVFPTSAVGYTGYQLDGSTYPGNVPAGASIRMLRSDDGGTTYKDLGAFTPSSNFDDTGIAGTTWTPGGTYTSTSNTAAFVAAATAAYAAGHRTIYVQPGTYYVTKLSSTNFFTDGALRIIGPGSDGTLQTPNIATGPTAVIRSLTGETIFDMDGAFDYGGTLIQDIRLIGVRTDAAGTGHGIDLHPDGGHEPALIEFRRVMVEDCSGAGIHTGGVAMWNTVFDHCTVDHCKQHNFWIGEGGNTGTLVTFINCLSHRPGGGYRAFRVQGSSGTHLLMLNCGGIDNLDVATFGGGFWISGNMRFYLVNPHVERFDGPAFEFGDGEANISYPFGTILNAYTDDYRSNNLQTAIRFHGAVTNLFPINIINASMTGSWAHSNHGITLEANAQLPNVRFETRNHTDDAFVLYRESDGRTWTLPRSYPGYDSTAFQNGDDAYVYYDGVNILRVAEMLSVGNSAAWRGGIATAANIPSGTYKVGEFFTHTNPTSSGTFGRICTTAGTANGSGGGSSTFTTFGAVGASAGSQWIDSGSDIYYSAGKISVNSIQFFGSGTPAAIASPGGDLMITVGVHTMRLVPDPSGAFIDASTLSDFNVRLGAGLTNAMHLTASTATFAGAISGTSYKVSGTQVVGARGAAVTHATGGSTVDTEARAAINALLSRLETHGLIAP